MLPQAVRLEWLEKQRVAALKAALKRGKKKVRKAEKDPKRALDKKLATVAKAKQKELAAVWKSLLDDLDEQMSKLKRCGLDDVAPALERLPAADRSELLAWAKVEGHSKKSVPSKGMNEAALALKTALLYGAAVLSFATPDIPAAENAGSKALRDKGLSCTAAAGQGFAPKELLKAVYPAQAVIRACPDVEMLRAAHFTPAQLMSAGLEAAVGPLGGAEGARRLRDAGYTPAQVREAGACNAHDMRRGGFALRGLLDGGYSATELRQGGFGSRRRQPTEYLAGTIGSLHDGALRVLQTVHRGGDLRTVMGVSEVPKPHISQTDDGHRT